MSIYTCIACRVVFAEGDTQRAHYKTDWHRYNLKRKVANLPPVTAENFRLRVLNAEQTQGNTKHIFTQVPAEKPSLTCSLCGKHFKNDNQMENHRQSKKHKEVAAKEAEREKKEIERRNEKNQEKGLEVAPENEPREKDMTNEALKESLAGPPSATGGGESIGAVAGTNKCDDDDSDVESVESFDEEDGLGIEECLFCSHISASLEENVNHMTVKHSFFLPDAEYISDLEGLITYLGEKVGMGHVCLWCNEKGKGFHSAKSVQQHMVDKGHCKMLHEGDVIVEYTDFYDYRSSYPDQGEVAAAGDDGGEEEGMETDDVGPEKLAADGYELVLPSGATVGHRSLARYYRQNINPRHVDGSRSLLPRMLAQYKALGWTGATGATAVRRVKDLGAMQRMKTRHFMRLGVKANKFQPHLRPQVVF